MNGLFRRICSALSSGLTPRANVISAGQCGLSGRSVASTTGSSARRQAAMASVPARTIVSARRGARDLSERETGTKLHLPGRVHLLEEDAAEVGAGDVVPRPGELDVVGGVEHLDADVERGGTTGGDPLFYEQVEIAPARVPHLRNRARRVAERERRRARASGRL